MNTDFEQETSSATEEAIRQTTPKRRAPKLAKLQKPRPQRLLFDQVAEWAGAWHQRTGIWPQRNSGIVPESPPETWAKIDNAFRQRCRGLGGFPSLKRFLVEHCGAPDHSAEHRLTVHLVLAWADAWYDSNGSWPHSQSGPVFSGSDVTWAHVNSALSKGHLGLAGGTTLAILLGAERRHRNKVSVPPLTCKEIREWGRSHKARTGKWPTRASENPIEAPDENWEAINLALVRGYRGLPGGSNLRSVMRRRPRNSIHSINATVTEEEILAWADAHYARTGKWPRSADGAIEGAPGEAWRNLDSALFLGLRGLPPGGSLARLLNARRGVRNHRSLKPFSVEQILEWADRWHEEYGKWPTNYSGQIILGGKDVGETWSAVDTALKHGRRGMPGGSSLSVLLRAERGDCARNSRYAAEPLSLETVRGWAVHHLESTGSWPRGDSGQIAGTDGLNWRAVANALWRGSRGLPARWTLGKLKEERL